MRFSAVLPSRPEASLFGRPATCSLDSLRCTPISTQRAVAFAKATYGPRVPLQLVANVIFLRSDSFGSGCSRAGTALAGQRHRLVPRSTPNVRGFPLQGGNAEAGDTSSIPRLLDSLHLDSVRRAGAVPPPHAHTPTRNTVLCLPRRGLRPLTDGLDAARRQPDRV